MKTKLIVKFKYIDRVAGQYDKLKEKITILTMEYDNITESNIIEECKKSISKYSQEFDSILDVTQLN